MRKLLFLNLFMLLVFNSYSQLITVKKKKYELKNIGDTYVADVIFFKPIYKAKCSCAFATKGRCNLYKGKITNVYFAAKKTVFDSVQLSNVVYFVTNLKLNLHSNKIYTVILTPGTTNRYLLVNRIMEISDPKEYQFISNDIYFSGYSSCLKIGIFNKMLLSLKLIKASNINYTKKALKKDVFDDFIQKQHDIN